MRRNLALIFFIVMFFSCKNRETITIYDSYIPKNSATNLQASIKMYYKLNAKDSLFNFLQVWKSQIPFSPKEYVEQNDTINNIYLVFADLYKPFKFGDYSTANYFEGKNKYVVIQNEINYAVVSTNEYRRLVINSSDGYPNDTAYEFYRNTKKLINFRPPLNCGNVNYLYLTKEYRQAINHFLNLGSFQGDIIMNDTIFNRYKFISPTLPIVYGQWGGYWHIETFPIIDRIIFDKNFKRAAVDFRFSLEETVLQYRITKKWGHWIADNKWLKIRLE